MLTSVLERCRAIPIIHSVGGLPNYDADLGRFPSINSSRPGWLNFTRRIMLDDTFYTSFLKRERRSVPSAAPGAGLPLRFHCQFFDADIRVQHRRYVAWEPCAYCEGLVEECQEIDRPEQGAIDAEGRPSARCLTPPHTRIIDTTACPAE